MPGQEIVLDRIDPVAEDVVALTLRGAHGSLAPWEPGAHIDLSLPNWLTRQYSLCGDPADRTRYRIAVRYDRLSRGGSEYVHRFLRTGRRLDISLPRNNFPLVDARSYLFIAGGIGITAILPMVRAARLGGARASLVYIGRNAASMPFTDELDELDGATVVATEHGARPDLAALAAELAEDTAVYCCGPASMLAAAESVFPADRLHVEHFRPAARTFAPNTAFEVVCARAGRTISVAADESLLDALNHRGIPVASGCREGVCGSCEVGVLDGEPEHRDDIGAPAGRMYPCVSRACSRRLVLDL